MPKLQKQKAWKRGDETYYKWVLVIPEEEVEKANFKEGEVVVIKAKSEGEIIVRKVDLELKEKGSTKIDILQRTTLDDKESQYLQNIGRKRKRKII